MEFLSTYTEIHSFAIGMYHGFKDFRDWAGIPTAVLNGNDDVASEPHYAKGGYIIGSLLRVACYVLIVYLTMH